MGESVYFEIFIYSQNIVVVKRLFPDFFMSVILLHTIRMQNGCFPGTGLVRNFVSYKKRIKRLFRKISLGSNFVSYKKNKNIFCGNVK